MLALVLTAALATIDDPPVAPLIFAQNYDKAFEEAKARNAPVLIMDFDYWEESFNPQPSAFFEDKKFIEMAQSFVLLASSQHRHEEKEYLVDGKPQMCSEVFRSVSAQAVQRVKGQVFFHHAKDGVLNSPFFYFLQPDGKMLRREENVGGDDGSGGERSPAEVMALMKKVLAKTGKGLTRDQFVQLQQGADEVERLLAQQELVQAVAIVRDVGSVDGDLAVQKRFREVAKKLDAEGKSQVTLAQKSWDSGGHLDALKKLDAVQGAFNGMSLSKDAGKLLSKLSRTPEGKAVSGPFKVFQKARKLYQQGIELDREGNAKKALTTLKSLTRRYPETQFADLAESTIRVLEDEIAKKKKKR